MNDSSLASLDSVSSNLTSQGAIGATKANTNSSIAAIEESSESLMAAVPSSVIQQPTGVIHASSNQLQQQLQNMHDNTDNPAASQEPAVHVLQEDDPKKRRDMLARRPSYRKILNDLCSDNPVKVENSYDQGNDSVSSSDAEETTAVTSSNSASSPLPMQVSSQSSDVPLTGLQTIQISGSNTQNHPPTVVQFTANGQAETQYILTTQGPGNKIQVCDAYTIRGQLPQSVVINSPPTMTQSPQQLAEEAARKREMRLLKNREAAKECRRKKKEYVKCLENRVAVLENQNKALIEELKSLKDLYCNKGE